MKRGEIPELDRLLSRGGNKPPPDARQAANQLADALLALRYHLEGPILAHALERKPLEWHDTMLHHLDLAFSAMAFLYGQVLDQKASRYKGAHTPKRNECRDRVRARYLELVATGATSARVYTKLALEFKISKKTLARYLAGINLSKEGGWPHVRP